MIIRGFSIGVPWKLNIEVVVYCLYTQARNDDRMVLRNNLSEDNPLLVADWWKVKRDTKL